MNTRHNHCTLQGAMMSGFQITSMILISCQTDSAPSTGGEGGGIWCGDNAAAGFFMEVTEMPSEIVQTISSVLLCMA